MVDLNSTILDLAADIVDNMGKYIFDSVKKLPKGQEISEDQKLILKQIHDLKGGEGKTVIFKNVEHLKEFVSNLPKPDIRDNRQFPAIPLYDALNNLIAKDEMDKNLERVRNNLQVFNQTIPADFYQKSLKDPNFMKQIKEAQKRYTEEVKDFQATKQNAVRALEENNSNNRDASLPKVSDMLKQRPDYVGPGKVEPIPELSAQQIELAQKVIKDMRKLLIHQRDNHQIRFLNEQKELLTKINQKSDIENEPKYIDNAAIQITNRKELSNFVMEMPAIMPIRNDEINQHIIELRRAVFDIAVGKIEKAEENFANFAKNIEANIPGFYNENYPAPQLSPRDPNLVLAEKLLGDMEKIIGKNPQSLENTALQDHFQFASDAKYKHDDKINFKNINALKANVDEYKKKYSVSVDHNAHESKSFIAQTFNVIDKLSNGQEVSAQEMHNLVKATERADPKFYNHVKRPKVPPAIDASREEIEAYNTRMTGVKGTGFKKAMKRTFKPLVKKLKEIRQKIHDIKDDGHGNQRSLRRVIVDKLRGSNKGRE